MVMIADMGDGGAPGSVQLTVRPENLREAANRMAVLADRLDAFVLSRIGSFQVQPCGADVVSRSAAGWFNDQISGGVTSGQWAVEETVVNLRASAAALAAAADRYEAGDDLNADAIGSGARA
jgi:hypothetical protein